MSINQSFKNDLLKIKLAYGLTQAEIAEQVGVQRTYLSNIVSNKCPLSSILDKKLHDTFPKAFQVTAGDHSQIIHNNSGTAINGGDEKTVVDRLQDQIEALLAQNDKLLAIIDNLTKK